MVGGVAEMLRIVLESAPTTLSVKLQSDNCPRLEETSERELLFGSEEHRMVTTSTVADVLAPKHGHLPGRARRARAPGGRNHRRGAVHPPAASHAACPGKLIARREDRRALRLRRRRSGRMVDYRRARASSGRGHRGPGPRGLAPGATAGVSRDRLRDARAGLGMRGALRLDTPARLARKSARSMPGKESGTCGSSTRRTAPSRRSSSARASGC